MLALILVQQAASWQGSLLERGQRPPAPARQGTRTQQVNVRLTAEEKAVLEATAKNQGFKGLSDLLRAAALDAAHGG